MKDFLNITYFDNFLAIRKNDIMSFEWKSDEKKFIINTNSNGQYSFKLSMFGDDFTMVLGEAVDEKNKVQWDMGMLEIAEVILIDDLFSEGNLIFEVGVNLNGKYKAYHLGVLEEGESNEQ